MIRDGYQAPYVKLFYKGKEIQERVESFKYKESEEDDENCEVNIRHDDRNAPDLPQYQEQAMWTVIFGFIGGESSPVRKIYLQELKWEFDDQNLLLTASFTERAVSVKQRSASKVYTKTSIVDILFNVAKVHGLTPFVEVPGQYTQPKQKAFSGSTKANSQDIDPLSLANKSKNQPTELQITDSIVQAIKSYAEKQVTKDQLDTTIFGSTEADIRQAYSSSGQNVPLSKQLSNREDIRNLLLSFNTYGTIPQANRSDKQVLDELVKRQPDGPFFIDSHDDKIILKRRHFDKPAHRQFHWADGDGELLAFQPESKNRSKKGSSVGVTVQGWDKKNKVFHSTNSNVDNESQQNTLANAQLKLTDLNTILEDKDKTLETQLTSKQFNLAHDNTNVVKLLPARILILDQKKVVEDQIAKFTEPTANNKVINDPTANNPKQGLINGGNARGDAELKNNPGYIEVVGDPTLHKGQIVTILGVSKKYSGNYYLKNVTHEIDGYKHYITRCDLVRHGINIKPNAAYADSKETGKTVNKTIGPDDGSNTNKLDLLNANIPPTQFNLSHDKTNVVKVLPELKIKPR